MLAHSPAAVPCSSLWFSEQKRNYSQSIARGRVAEGSLRKAFYPNTAPMLRKYNDLEKPFPVEISTQKIAYLTTLGDFVLSVHPLASYTDAIMALSRNLSTLEPKKDCVTSNTIVYVKAERV